MSADPGSSSALVIGVGGLGCSAALELAFSGVRVIGLMDPDRVELSNLHRQILFEESDLGKPKAETAASHLRSRFPGLTVTPVAESFPNPGWDSMVRPYDLVVDGLDRLEKKYLLNDACMKAGKPFVHAGVLSFGGQVLAVRPGETACLRCVLPDMPSDNLWICEKTGILGPVAQWGGTWEAREALGLLTRRDPPFLWTFSAIRREIRALRPIRNPECPACGNR